MMGKKGFIAIAVIAVIVAVFLVGKKTEDKPVVTIVAADNQWDSEKIHNAIAKIVLEEGYDGYKLDFSVASTPMNWQSMLSGEVDLEIECWTQNMATYDEDIASGRLVNVGVLLPDSTQGIYVPRYVIMGDEERNIKASAPDLKTVSDIKKYPNVFPDDEDKSRGRLYGAIPGWMVDEILYKKYKYYDLDSTFNYVRLGSEASLFASLAAAYNKGETWIGYCYEPTWIVGKLDLVRLEDAPFDEAVFKEGKCEFPSMELKVVANPKLKAKAPEAYEFFSRYKTGSELISKALAHMDESGKSHEDTAIWFLKTNDELLDDWMPEANAKKLREYLSRSSVE